MESDATESFWFAASYLLAMCISQPTIAQFSTVFGCRNVILASILLLGIGSTIIEASKIPSIFLLGRSIQGVGAGGLTVLSYIAYGDLDPISAGRFLGSLSASISLGTICGPLIGASLNNKTNWRWLFRLNTPICIVLGILTYNSSQPPRHSKHLSSLNIIASILLTAGIIPILTGISLTGSLYKWQDWEVILLLSLGISFLTLFLVRELYPGSIWFFVTGKRTQIHPLLGLRNIHSFEALLIFLSGMFLGFLMYAMLFLLPIYYRVIKQQPDLITGVLLLPQTLTIAPCAGIVLILIDVARLSYRWAVLFGWLCTTCGVGLLTLLSVEKSLWLDVLLNIPSGIGIGLLLPALTLASKESNPKMDTLVGMMLLIFMRYLGCATGLITIGIAFQVILRQQLRRTPFQNQAEELTRYATKLVASIRTLPDSPDRETLIGVTEETIRTLWIIITAVSALFMIAYLVAMALENPANEISEQCEGAAAWSQTSLTISPISSLGPFETFEIPNLEHYRSYEKERKSLERAVVRR